ncbi:hypothetical protein B0A52_04071 [Exophiala mesophila]|uniref:Uncharacterized protein n=1 Tax=Exophiala mesophila TaxID=212818 RepID=A0A438NAL9_EXOME|nr:hypothetical protein B0A52_04071 [Exophiala mesophila]
MDDDDRADDAARDHDGHGSLKSSRRDRFKGALARTRSKFKKAGDRLQEKDSSNDDNVDDFLAAGRPSLSGQPSNTVPPASSHNPHDASIPSITPTGDSASPRPSTSDSSSFQFARQSPRRIVVPRIDVSTSPRYPSAQPIASAETTTPYSGGGENNSFLQADYKTRSMSSSSLAKGKRRGRGLSVTFIEAPPTVIGIGGDDAPAPTVEISKARARARSVSPMSSRPQPVKATSPTSRALDVTSNGPRPNPAPPFPTPGGVSRQSPPDILRPRALHRIQTGLEPNNAIGMSDLDKEFAMTLKMESPASSTASPATPEIIAPKPYRPIQPPPVMEDAGAPSVGHGLEEAAVVGSRTEDTAPSQSFYSGRERVGHHHHGSTPNSATSASESQGKRWG